jgi:hypothetical protein
MDVVSTYCDVGSRCRITPSTEPYGRPAVARKERKRERRHLHFLRFDAAAFLSRCVALASLDTNGDSGRDRT